jgi:hypothetical protein
MPLIFNSVTQFYEQIGRRQTHYSNPITLDTLECIFVGDATGTSSVCPSDLAIHPEFPGMRCSGWNIVSKEALMAEVRAQYSGKLLAGSGPYTTPPLITTSRHLGSISYTTSRSTTPIQVQTASYTVRFTAKAVEFKYLTNRLPSSGFDGNFASQAAPYLGTENLQTFQTALSFATGAAVFSAALGYGGYVVSTLTWHNDLSNLQVEDLGNGWFSVSEVYMTQPYINTSIA